MNGWMGDLQFYVLSNSFSVISGQCEGDIEKLYAIIRTLFTIQKIAAFSGSPTGTPRSVGQHLTD